MLSGTHDGGAVKKRSIGDGDDTRTLTIPHIKEEPDAPVPTQSRRHINPITLRLFVRELLRHSKTSCSTLEVALCYLYGVGGAVKRLKDCVKLEIAFGTAAMAERGPYDEGMKDEGRIIKYEEWARMKTFEEAEQQLQQQQQQALQQDEVMGDSESSWTPFSPKTDISDESRTTSKQPTASNQVLATHPLLDARRTFLASLILATKFIQDKAYSNKAWAKLSGPAGSEVGRCERALGGALGWRLWVGKDYDGTSVRGKSRPSTPAVETSNPPSSTSLDSDDSVVHGEDDALAKQFMVEARMAAEMKAKATAGWASTSMETAQTLGSVAPAPLAPAQVGNLLLAARAGCGRACAHRRHVVLQQRCHVTHSHPEWLRPSANVSSRRYDFLLAQRLFSCGSPPVGGVDSLPSDLPRSWSCRAARIVARQLPGRLPGKSGDGIVTGTTGLVRLISNRHATHPPLAAVHGRPPRANGRRRHRHRPRHSSYRSYHRRQR